MSLAEYNWVITDKLPSQTWELGEYQILNENSGGGTFAAGSSQSTIGYICEYFYVEKFLDTILGKTVKSGSSLLRSAPVGTPVNAPGFGSTPEAHPYWENFFAASADVKPAGAPYNDSDDLPLWSKALVTVAFRPNNYNIITDSDFGTNSEYLRFTSKVPEGQADFQTSMGFFNFVADPIHRQLDVVPGFTVASCRSNYTWKQIPVKLRASDSKPDLGSVPNLSTILPLLGSVNSTTFDGYYPGTVLFISWQPTLILPQVATANNYYWDITYTFGIRDYGVSTTPYVSSEHIGWNYAFDPLRGVWDLYTSGAVGVAGTIAGKPQYPYANLANLFSVGW